MQVTNMPTESWVQYGCFTLLAGLVVWALYIGIPAALKMHKDTIDGMMSSHKEAIGLLVVQYEKEAEQCREERIEESKSREVEREKERQLRHDMMNKFQVMLYNGRPEES